MASLLDSLLKKPAAKEKETEPCDHSEQELKIRLLRLIIDRYREKIEEYETKTVADMKGMVLPREQEIEEIRDKITEDFHPYVYDEHFLSAAKMCFEFVSSFKTVSLPVSFWLTFEEMKELMAGDEIDKSLLLCSILRSLGSENAKVFVTDSKNSYVLFQFSGKSFVADHSKKELQEAASGAEAFKLLSGKIMYSFNDKEYEDFQETE